MFRQSFLPAPTRLVESVAPQIIVPSALSSAFLYRALSRYVCFKSKILTVSLTGLRLARGNNLLLVYDCFCVTLGASVEYSASP